MASSPGLEAITAAPGVSRAVAPPQSELSGGVTPVRACLGWQARPSGEAVRLLPGAGGRPLHSSDSVPASGYRGVAVDPAGLGGAVAHRGEAVEAGQVLAGQVDFDRTDVVLEVGAPLGAGNRHHVVAVGQ
jgi:hypothetical protein